MQIASVVLVVLMASCIEASVPIGGRSRRPKQPNQQPFARSDPPWAKGLTHNDLSTEERQFQNCRAASALAQNLCSQTDQGFKQTFRGLPIIKLIPSHSADSLRQHGSIPSDGQGYRPHGSVFKFWEQDSVSPHFRYHNGHVEPLVDGVYVIAAQVTFNSIGLVGCISVRTQEGDGSIKNLTTAIYQGGGNRFTRCVSECTETERAFRAQASVATTAMIQMVAGQRIWIESCYSNGYRDMRVLTSGDLTHWTIFKMQ